MGQLRAMGYAGDIKVIWDPEKPDEVDVARRTFDELKEKGYNAYSVKRRGDKGEVVRKFDPEAEKIIMAPPMAGGA